MMLQWRKLIRRAGITLTMALTMTGAAHAAGTMTCGADQALFPDLGLAIGVEIADDPAERAQGLMNRESLDPLAGMLFIYESPRPASFWMKNTLIPLDMIFMDAQGVIRHIHHRAVPLDLTPVAGHAAGDPDPRRLMVLEIAGGEAQRLGLREGMAMAFPGLDQSRAAAPCQ